MKCSLIRLLLLIFCYITLLRDGLKHRRFENCLPRYQDGIEIHPSGKYRITEDGNMSQLVIKGVTPEEAGEITCELRNPKGRESASAKLTVQRETCISLTSYTPKAECHFFRRHSCLFVVANDFIIS